MSKFTTGLVKEHRENEEQKIEQKKLHKKYGVENENVVVVEKNNTVKFLIRTLANIVHTIFSVILILLAVVGLTTLTYPEIRVEFLFVLNQIIIELETLLGIAMIGY